MKSPLYVPVIKGKINDIVAVGQVSRQVRENMKPLIEAMPIASKKIGIDEHVHKFCQYIRKNVPLGEIFVDFYGLMPDACIPDGTNATIFGYQLLKGLGRSVTPVYGLERNDELWEDLRGVVEKFRKGFAFRLRQDDLGEDVIEETWSSILERSSQLNLSENEIDLILDLSSLAEQDIVDLKETIVTFLFGNPRVRHYRSIVVSSSSALRTVGEIEKNSSAEVTRSELYLWCDLWNDLPDEVRPIYSDYGIVHPDFSDMGPNKFMNAKIRYTVGDKILYFRGHGLLYPTKDYEQYRTLARRVRADPRYRSEELSIGNHYLSDCANGHGTPGTPGTWIKADMNHHMTYVVMQIDRLITAFADASTEIQASNLLTRI